MITEILVDTMHLPLVISDCDGYDDFDDNSWVDDVKITTREHKLVVLMTILVILEILISDSLEVLLMNPGGNGFALIVFSAISYSYIFLGLIGVFFVGKLGRTYKELFQFLTIILFFSRVVLIVLMSCSAPSRRPIKVMVGDLHPI